MRFGLLILLYGISRLLRDYKSPVHLSYWMIALTLAEFELSIYNLSSFGFISLVWCIEEYHLICSHRTALNLSFLKGLYISNFLHIHHLVMMASLRQSDDVACLNELITKRDGVGPIPFQYLTIHYSLLNYNLIVSRTATHRL